MTVTPVLPRLSSEEGEPGTVTVFVVPGHGVEVWIDRDTDPETVLSKAELKLPPVGRLLMIVVSVVPIIVDNSPLGKPDVRLLKSEETELEKEEEVVLVGKVVTTELSVGKEIVAEIEVDKLAEGLFGSVIEDVKVRTMVVVPVVSKLVTRVEVTLLAPVKVSDVDVSDSDIGNPVEIPPDDE